MEALPATAWHKACSRCKKPTFEDLLDEEGRCDYCREIVTMKVSSSGRPEGRRVKNRFM